MCLDIYVFLHFFPPQKNMALIAHRIRKRRGINWSSPKMDYTSIRWFQTTEPLYLTSIFGDLTREKLRRHTKRCTRLLMEHGEQKTFPSRVKTMPWQRLKNWRVHRNKESMGDWPHIALDGCSLQEDHSPLLVWMPGDKWINHQAYNCGKAF